MIVGGYEVIPLKKKKNLDESQIVEITTDGETESLRSGDIDSGDNDSLRSGDVDSGSKSRDFEESKSGSDIDQLSHGSGEDEENMYSSQSLGEDEKVYSLGEDGEDGSVENGENQSVGDDENGSLKDQNEHEIIVTELVDDIHSAKRDFPESPDSGRFESIGMDFENTYPPKETSTVEPEDEFGLIHCTIRSFIYCVFLCLLYEWVLKRIF